jgi:glyoxylase-like metal-dependent hydrolase (beta-lactamase superfamily II)
VKRIRLHNTEFEGLNNVYLLDDGEETALIDAGTSHPTIRADLDDGLAAIGRSLADVDEIYLTHWHYDHAGLAGELQQESGADVYAHEADAPLIAGDEESVLREQEQQREMLTEWGVPDGPSEELTTFLETHMDLAGESVDVTTFSGGETFTAAGVTFETVHLPGHAAGLTGFAVADASQLAATAGDAPDDLDSGDTAAFVGDAILPKYTPNVGGADVRVEDPLAKYVESLVEIVERDWTVAYPGHRDRIDDPAGRAATILDHHRERTERVIDALETHGASTPWEVSAELFGELENIHILHGPGEAYAHLDHLESHDVVEKDGTEYELLDASVAVESLFPEVGIDRVVEPASD